MANTKLLFCFFILQNVQQIHTKNPKFIIKLYIKDNSDLEYFKRKQQEQLDIDERLIVFFLPIRRKVKL